jgi:hypothetical protein
MDNETLKAFLEDIILFLIQEISTLENCQIHLVIEISKHIVLACCPFSKSICGQSFTQLDALVDHV